VNIVCLDLEGVLIPEIWIALADATGIDELRATTRDEPDYDKLMRFRLGVLEKNGLGIAELDAAAQSIEPLPGALAFLASLRERFQVVILSDTYYELTGPAMKKLGYPTLFCHRLEIANDGRVAGYRLRMPDHKTAAVQAFKGLGFKVLAAGDSYNDTGMLGAADTGFLFCAPASVVAEFPAFAPITTYEELLAAFAGAWGFNG
jgi:phosphoserine/homoserine phosphotransferase